ncbi:MAG: DEAD/DEAH box helicase [Planctomycetaceae bacterium]|nr:DEAD/DEAH box helicase [Planctomycetota bacterium]MCK6530888.1 DEAD/DEAH box helicase [Myxococcota bacterium]NUN53187.1 DEAD/DEAH box helicase [Planctomycetaceae bacterium]
MVEAPVRENDGLALRPYQVEAVRALRAAFAAGKRAPVYQLPTGGGKTVVFAHIAREGAKRGTRVLILVHRRELLLQGSRALREVGLDHGLIAPTLPPSDAQVRIASVQTLVRRLDHVSPPDLVVIDEAHHAVAGSWRRVLEQWPRARVLGVTATPARLDGKGLGVHVDGPFDHLVLGPSVRALTEAGFLAPADVYAPPMKADLSGVGTRLGDFDRREMRLRMDKPVISGDAVDHYLRLTPGRPAIAFCTSVEHAEHVAEAFTDADVPAASIDGGMSDVERDGVLEDLARGEIQVLTSCEIVSEGFDLPAVEVAILLRPTQSLTLYLQQVGRVLRPAPGKASATVLDHVGNVKRHGLPDADRSWDLDGAMRRSAGEAPVCRCPECFACHPPARMCPVCGHVYGGEGREGLRVDPDAQLERVSRAPRDLWTPVRERMRQAHIEQGRCRTFEELVDLGIRRGYGNPRAWARNVWRARHRSRRLGPSVPEAAADEVSA